MHKRGKLEAGAMVNVFSGRNNSLRSTHKGSGGGAEGALENAYFSVREQPKPRPSKQTAAAGARQSLWPSRGGGCIRWPSESSARRARFAGLAATAPANSGWLANWLLLRSSRGFSGGALLLLQFSNVSNNNTHKTTRRSNTGSLVWHCRCLVLNASHHCRGGIV